MRSFRLVFSEYVRHFRLHLQYGRFKKNETSRFSLLHEAELMHVKSKKHVRAWGRNKSKLRALLGKRLVFFDILWRQHEHKKAKLTVNFFAFPSAKFHKIWQTGYRYFTLVGAQRSLFFREIYQTSFSVALKGHKRQILKNCQHKPYSFSCLKFASRRNRYVLWKFWKFRRKKFKKIKTIAM